MQQKLLNAVLACFWENDGQELAPINSSLAKPAFYVNKGVWFSLLYLILYVLVLAPFTEKKKWKNHTRSWEGERRIGCKEYTIVTYVVVYNRQELLKLRFLKSYYWVHFVLEHVQEEDEWDSFLHLPWDQSLVMKIHADDWLKINQSCMVFCELWRLFQEEEEKKMDISCNFFSGGGVDGVFSKWK